MPTNAGDSENEDAAFLSPEEEFRQQEESQDHGASPKLRRSARKRKSVTSASDMARGSEKKKKASPTANRVEDPGKSMPRIPRTPVNEGPTLPSPPRQSGRTGVSTLEELLKGMEERLASKIDATNLKVDATNHKVDKALALAAETNTALEDLEIRVAATEEGLEARIQEAEARLQIHFQDQVKSLVLDQLRTAGFDPDLTAGDMSTIRSSTMQTYAGAAASGVNEATKTADTPKKNRQERQEDKYWDCRKSLRPWQVEQPTASGVGEFFKSKLAMDDESVKDMGRLAVRRVRERKPRYEKEVIVTFDTVSSRDYVKSLAPNLANFQEEAGMRLQIPDHLQKLFRSYMNLSYDL